MIIVIFITVVFGSFSILSVIGLLVGLMTPFIEDKSYGMDTAKFISVTSIAGFIFTNGLASYFGFRRYHRHYQSSG